MSSEATSQDEGGASGANPGSGGSSSSQAPTPEVAEISQGNSVATISPAIVYNKLGQVYDVQHETTKAVDDFAVPAGYRRVGTREASFMYRACDCKVAAGAEGLCCCVCCSQEQRLLSVGRTAEPLTRMVLRRTRGMVGRGWLLAMGFALFCTVHVLY